LENAVEWKCRKKKDNENLKATIPSTDNGGSETTGVCGIF
jgi:hypothetical protein